ncbi:MAG TPA: LPXTG cell wall anchor domain-containing protein, partial [Bacillota bacterium]|nr:LPXTG cell wall anchor domain-containing protein [Bacillota bacterium]
VEVSPQGVNKAEKYIWAELTGFSTFAVFGEVSPSEDLPKTEGTQVYLAVLAALFAIGGLFALLRRKLAKEN